MDELTPLKPIIAQSTKNSERLNPTVTLAVNRFKRGPTASRISFSLKERQRALSQVGVGQAAHLCRDGEFAYIVSCTN